MNEKKLKHLEFIQLVITRMNTNSFMIKGWSVTIVAALFALAAKDSNYRYIIIAFFPLFIFWILDGFYLAQERHYRELYSEVARKDENEIDFNMKPCKNNKMYYGWGAAVFSGTLFIFYGTLISIICVVCLIISPL